MFSFANINTLNSKTFQHTTKHIRTYFTWSMRSSSRALHSISLIGTGGGRVSLGLLGLLIEAVAASHACTAITKRDFSL